jgi:polysaccharide deacetylase family protein (PEP-CTERM system associated)
VPRHHFTVDVEEYFHPSALEPFIAPETWDGLPRRSPAVVDRILETLAARDIRSTFFIVGWLAEREPGMVERIARAGHEVGSHSWDHRRVTEQTPDEFRTSVRRTKAYLEDLTGQAVLGFRAPSFSIVPGLEWALDVLIEEGYAYDSSLFPVSQHPTYGYPDAERFAHWIDRPAGRLAEIPPSTLRVFGSNLPASGGAYFRLLPYSLTRSAFRQANAEGRNATFYTHPWEFDDWVPDLRLAVTARLRTFGGRRKMWRRVERFLDEFEFAPMRDTLAAMTPNGVLP